MNNQEQTKPQQIELEDIQALLRFGHGALTDSIFLLLNITQLDKARQWLKNAPVSSALDQDPIPEQALHIAFSVQGLRYLQIDETIIDGFSDEFIVGMCGDESRSRRLGDIDQNAPEHWQWGNDATHMPHILLMLYSKPGEMETFRSSLLEHSFKQCFDIVFELPTAQLTAEEPFGFVDGLSQPKVDWVQQQSTDLHYRDQYSNLLAPGELVLGYRNEYGLFTPRPLINSDTDEVAENLPEAIDQPGMKDLGKNGCYLVIRQLQQDVSGFWKYVDQATGSDEQAREQLAASMVGRHRDGTPLIKHSRRRIAGISPLSTNNHFDYALDANGITCPVTAHIRRSNPRTGDYPVDVNGFWSRMMRLLGFHQQRPDEDLIASSRFHRLLRRGRSYGTKMTPQQAIESKAPKAERGLQFICLVANISRQFEFVQNAWNMKSNFAGLHNERDPLIGTREPLIDKTPTNQFRRPLQSGVTCDYKQLPQFVTMRGGGYFFMPGICALRYMASVDGRNRENSA